MNHLLRALITSLVVLFLFSGLIAQGDFDLTNPDKTGFPDCEAPIFVHVTDIGLSHFGLEWTEPEDAFGSYYYEVRYRLFRQIPGTSDPWKVVPVKRIMGVVLNQLIPGMTYELEVRRVCEANIQHYSKWKKLGLKSTLSNTGQGRADEEEICAQLTGAESTLSENNDVIITWDGPEASAYGYRYELRYRFLGPGSASNWVTDEITSGTSYAISGLSSNQVHEFEIRLVWKNGDSPSYPIYCDWIEIGSVAISDALVEEEEEDPVISLPEFECGEEYVPVTVDETSTLTTADTGDIFYITGFPILLTQVSGGNGTFSGAGIIPLPFGETTLSVSFSGVSVNANSQIYSGNVNGIPDDPDNYPALVTEVISLGGAICIPPQQTEGFDENGIHSETGLPWDPRGFGPNGQYVQQPPYEGYNEGDPYDLDYDPNGFDANGNHVETGTPYNPSGCNQLGLTEDGQECDPSGSSPYYWLQDEDTEPTQEGIALAGMVADTLDDMITTVLAQYLQTAEDSITLTANTCSGIRTEMETQLTDLGYDRTFIFGEEDKYFAEGMAEYFTEEPKIFGINMARNPTHEAFEENHVELWECDDVLTKLKCGKDYILSQQTPEAVGVLTQNFITIIKAFSAEDAQTYENLDNLYAWVEQQLTDLIETECGIGDNDDGLGYNLPVPAVNKPYWNKSLLSDQIMWADANMDIPTDDLELLLNQASFQYMQGYQEIAGVNRTYFMEAIKRQRMFMPPGEAAHDKMPIVLSKQVAGREYAIYLDNIVFSPQGATLDAYFLLEIPTSGDKLLFKALNISFGPTGMTAETKLTLGTDFGIRLNNAAKLYLRGTDDTYVSWDCNGFAGMGIDAEIEFCREYLIPLDENTLEVKPDPERARAHFIVDMPAWGEFVTEISVDPFAIAGAEDVKWQVNNAVLDFSNVTTPSTVVFPQNYTSTLVREDGTPSPLWKGFFLQELTVTMPDELTGLEAGETSGDPVSFSAYNVIIDDRGVTGRAAVSNPLPLSDGKSLGQWAFSIDTIGITVMANNLSGIDFDGLINVPIFRNSTASNAPITEGDCFRYDAQILPGNVYNFALSPNTDSTFNVPIWIGKANLNHNSTFSIEYSNGEFALEAVLHGDVTIGEVNENVDLSVPALTFQGLTIQNHPPYFKPGTWDFPDEIGGQFAGFGIMLRGLGMNSTSNPGEAAFNLGVDVKLVGDAVQIEAGGSFDLVGELEVVNGRQRWNYKNFKVNELTIETSFPGVDKLNGQLIFFDQHATFGTGFRGVVEARFAGTGGEGAQSVGFDALAHFGRKEQNGQDFKYFFVDAMVHLSPGLPIVPGLNMVGFGGGAYYHMNRDTSQQSLAIPLVPTNTSPEFPVLGESLSGVLYTPNINAGLGLKASVAIATQKEAAFNANLTFEINFYAGGGLDEARFYGNGKFMEELDVAAPPEYASSGEPNNNAAVNFYLDILYNHSARTLDASFEVYMQIGDIVKGAGENNKFSSAEAHFGPDGWYIHAGTPTNRNGIIFTVPGVDGLGFTIQSYLMIGKDIPAMPSLPSYVADLTGAGNFMANESLRASGNGFAFGANASISTGEKEREPFYANFLVDIGFDVMLQDYGDAVCAQDGDQIGINGWYASGQAWGYVKGDIGLKFRLFGSDRQAKILTVEAGAVLQMKLPNPFWAQASIGGRYSIMGGLVKGQCNFQAEIGESCQIAGADDPVESLTVILDVAPADEAKQVSVNTRPNASFNLPVGEEFQVTDINGNTSTYKAEIVDATLTKISPNGNYEIYGDVAPTAGGMAMDFVPVNMLPPNDSFSFDLTVKVFKDGQELDEEIRSVGFSTGEALDYIPEGNVTASYPLNGQYNFYRDEWSEHDGYIILETGQPDLFYNIPEGYTQGVRLEAKGVSLPNVLLPLEYDATEKKISFPLPTALLHPDKIYKLEIVNKANNNSTGSTYYDSESTTSPLGARVDETFDPTTTVVPPVSSTQETFSDAYETDSPNNSSTSNTTPPDQILYTLYFRVSEYDKLVDKLDAIEQNYQDITPNYGYKVRSDIGIGEPFDNFELGRDGLTDNLINCSVSLENSSWYNQEVIPILYDYFPGVIPAMNGNQEANLTITRRPVDLGTPPVAAIYLDYPADTEIEINVHEGIYQLGHVPGVDGIAQYIDNDVLYVIYQDFLDYDKQLRDALNHLFSSDPGDTNTPPPPPPPIGEPWVTYQNHIETPTALIFPDRPNDTYPVTFTYRLPGTNVPTTIYTIQLGNE